MRHLSPFVSLVKFEHTVFALPFAYAGMLLALHSAHRPLTAHVFVWVTLAMVGARTLAMALNRLIDAEIDARNPRTAGREIPSGRLTVGQVGALCVGALVLLLAATTQLAPITRWLWPIPVAMFVLYPYTKRFTWGCHFVLGACTGLAPTAAWLAVRGDVTWTPVLLTLASTMWIGGFDVIYATSDVEFDRREQLQSLPARLGIRRALLVTRGMHLVTVAALVAVGAIAGLGAGYWIGAALVFALLAYENAIVRSDDLSRVDAAFFTTNGVIGVVFIAAVAAGLLV